MFGLGSKGGAEELKKPTIKREEEFYTIEKRKDTHTKQTNTTIKNSTRQ